MTDQESDKRKKIWESMSKEKQAEADREMLEILNKYRKQEDEIVEDLKRMEKWKGGLDGYYPELIELSKQREKSLRKLQRKYGLII